MKPTLSWQWTKMWTCLCIVVLLGAFWLYAVALIVEAVG